MNQAEDQNNPKIENLQLSTSGSGAAANDGGVAAGKMGIAIKGDIQGDVHYHGLIEEKTSIPHQGPPPPPNYIPREQEIALIETLCQEGNQITLIQGESGVGKTSLAASLVDHFQAEEYFNDGILWGDMSETDAHEQLWYFADSIGLKQRVGAKSHTLPRDLFWNALVDKQVLLVLDNITDSKIVEQIVSPSLSTGKWKKCRILLIAIPNQKFEISIDYQLSLDPFSNEEAEAFFKKALDGSILNQYSDILFDIAQELNFYPNTIVAATQKFIRGDGNPYTYLQQLRLAEKQPQEIYRAFWEAHSLNIQGLSDDQIRLLELTAVLSTADFSYEMIAAIALRKPTEIQHELNGLVQRGLLQVTDKERFTRNLDFHEFLKSRLQAWANYELQAAYHLLARYCIDLAHDLAEKYGLNTALIADSISVSRYQRELLDEMPHFRKIFNWALEQSDWQILRRFAHYPYFGLLRDLFTNSFYTRFSFEMATIANVLVTHNGRQSIFHVKECIGNSHGLWPAIRPGKYLFGINGDIRTHARYSKEFERPSIGLSSRTRRRAGRHILGDKITGDIYSLDGVSDQLSSEPTRPELSLNFYASHTVNLQFSQVDIIDTVWVAVHAHNLNFYRISFVGTHFLGCYLQHSGFFECEARGIDFSGSDLSGSVFRDVDFRGAIFTNTILKDTVFDNVDLRGSNLKGANFSGAAIKHTNLDGCNLIDTVWKDVTGTPLLSDEDRLFAKHIFSTEPTKIELEAIDLNNSTSNLDNYFLGLSNDPLYSISVWTNFLFLVSKGNMSHFKDINGSSAIIYNSVFEGETQFQNMTMVGATIAEARFEGGTIFNDIPMQGITIFKTIFEGDTVFIHSSMKGTRISETRFEGGIDFQQTDLTGVVVKNCIFEGGFLGSNIDLKQAQIVDSVFEGDSLFDQARMSLCNISKTVFAEGSSFIEADIRAASFAKVELQSASFRGADLSWSHLFDINLDRGDISDAKLSSATLEKVSLVSANLTGVDLSRARLIDVNLRGAKLQDANLLNVNLDSVVLLGVDLTEFGYLMLSKNFVANQFRFGWELLSDDLKMKQDFADTFWQLAKLSSEGKNLDIEKTQQIINVLDEGLEIVIEILYPILTQQSYKIILDSSSHPTNISIVYDDTILRVNEAKADLQQLIAQLNLVAHQVPPNNTEEAEVIAELAQTLIETASSDRPNKTMMKIMGEGLKQAAKNLAEIVPNIVQIVDNIVTATLSMVQEHKYIAWHPELQQLVAQLNMVLQQVPPNNTEEAEVIAELAQTLIETASSDRPNKTMMKIMGEGLKQAAKNLAEIVPNIVQIVDNIVTATLVLG